MPFPIDTATGKVFTDSVAAVAKWADGMPYTAAGALAVSVGAPTIFSGGFGFVGGKLAVVSSDSAPSNAVFNAGLAFKGTGELYVTSATAATRFANGLPVTGYGGLSVTNAGTPTAVLLSHMDTTGFVDVFGHSVSTSGSPAVTAGQAGFSNCLDITATTKWVEWSHASDFTMGNGDFWVEFWVRPTQTGIAAECFIDMGGAVANNGFKLASGSAGGTLRLYYAGGQQNNTGFSLPNNAWIHVAMGRQAGIVGVWTGGISRGNVAVAYNHVGTTVRIGAAGDGTLGFIGRMDEIRMYKGFCPYAPSTSGTIAFTPPSAPFPDA